MKHSYQPGKSVRRIPPTPISIKMEPTTRLRRTNPLRLNRPRKRETSVERNNHHPRAPAINASVPAAKPLHPSANGLYEKRAYSPTNTKIIAALERVRRNDVPKSLR